MNKVVLQVEIDLKTFVALSLKEIALNEIFLFLIRSREGFY